MGYNSVIIKSNKYGLVVILDDKIPFSELLYDIEKKFQKAAKFFKNAEMAVTFTGRELSKQEEKEVIETITNNSKINIICVVDERVETEAYFQKAIEAKKQQESEDREGQFYKGTLRSGQILEAETSIIVLGDVNPGANIISKGNVIVLGTLNGTVHAGAAGNESCFIAALDMIPIQLRIGDIIAKPKQKNSKKNGERDFQMDPKIAFVQEERICLKPISKDVMGQIAL